MNQLTLPVGGTHTVPVNPSAASTVPMYNETLVSGTNTLTSNYIIAAGGTPNRYQRHTVYWNALATPGSYTVTMFGNTIPTDLLAKKFRADFVHNGSTWDCYIAVDPTSIRLDGANLKAASVADSAIIGMNGSKLTAGTVANAALGSGLDGAKLSAGTVPNAALGSGLDGSKMSVSSIPLNRLTENPLLYDDHSDAGTPASLVETTLAEYTLAGGKVDVDGETIHVIAWGTTAANANAKTIRLYFGSDVHMVNSIVTAPNAKTWKLEAWITRSGATSSSGFAELKFQNSAYDCQGTKATPTWASDILIKLTGENGVATLNDIVCSGLRVLHEQ